MKKSLALTSASVLGIGMVAVGAVPAQAADITTPCTSVDDHAVTTGTLGDNWFMDCVPQYGMGKVGFTLTSVDPFPSDFKTLDDPAVSTVYSGDAAAAALYSGVTGEPAGFAALNESLPASSHKYIGNFMLPITGVQSIAPDDLPAACNAGTLSYSHAYQIDYGSASTTFTQTAGGETWTYEVLVAPTQPVYFGLNFLAAGGDVDSALPQCIIFNDQNFLTDSTTDPDEAAVVSEMLKGQSGGPGTTLWPYIDEGGVLGSIAPTATGGSGPGLPPTGVDTAPGALIGGFGLLAGFGLFAFARRMRRRTS